MSKTRKRIFKALGLMSGTSLDGVDAAVIKTDGERVLGFGERAFIPYDKSERAVLSHAIKQAAGWGFTGNMPDFRTAEHVLHKAHLRAAQQIIKQENNIDIVGFHGQTLLHRPPQNGKPAQSLQIGCGQKLADALGIDVVYDFRANDIKNGGHGAPLAPVYHRALAEYSKIKLPVAIINIGGVANLTLIDNDEIYASDCGPGNGPIDDWTRQNGLGEYDEFGRLALSGSPDIALVEKWLQGEFFKKLPPKSADRHDFNVLADLQGFSPQDGAASLAVFTACSIGKCLAFYNKPVKTMIICGGGRKNRAIMAALAEQRTGRPVNADKLSWDGDALEAQAFGFLAVRSRLGLPLSYPQTSGAIKPVSGGKFVSPQSR